MKWNDMKWHDMKWNGMDEWMNEWMKWMNEWMNDWMNEWMNGWRHDVKTDHGQWSVTRKFCQLNFLWLYVVKWRVTSQNLLMIFGALSLDVEESICIMCWIAYVFVQRVLKTRRPSLLHMNQWYCCSICHILVSHSLSLVSAFSEGKYLSRFYLFHVMLSSPVPWREKNVSWVDWFWTERHPSWSVPL